MRAPLAISCMDGPFSELLHSMAECGEGTWTTVMATYAPEHTTDSAKASSELYHSSPSPIAQSYFLFPLPQRLTTNPCPACHNPGRNEAMMKGILEDCSQLAGNEDLPGLGEATIAPHTGGGPSAKTLTDEIVTAS